MLVVTCFPTWFQRKVIVDDEQNKRLPKIKYLILRSVITDIKSADSSFLNLFNTWPNRKEKAGRYIPEITLKNDANAIKIEFLVFVAGSGL